MRIASLVPLTMLRKPNPTPGRGRSMKQPQSLAVLVLFWGIGLCSVWGQNRDFDALYRKKMGDLAAQARQSGASELASDIQRHAFERDPSRQYIFLKKPTRIRFPSSPASAEWVKSLKTSLTEARNTQAKRLFELAKSKVVADPAHAFQLLHEVLYEDPNHIGAKKILGGLGEPKSMVRTRSATQTHPWFGWSSREYRIVQSEHFEVYSRMRGTAARDMALQLERLYDVWQQVFFYCHTDGRWLKARFQGKSESLQTSSRFQVVLFRDREGYVRELSALEPKIQQSLGYYLPERKVSFFYHDRNPAIATWYHEATHQLFQERAAGIPDPGERSYIWLIEGLALYMESLRFFEGYATIGGFDATRLQFARYRRFQNDYFVPFPELTKMGRASLLERDDVRKIYSQSAGLVHFLMDGNGGELRASVNQVANRVYQGRESLELLTQATGLSVGELSQGYSRFLQVTDDDLQFIGASELVHQLSLGATQVTPKGIQQLSHLRDLRWCDLSGIPVGSADVVWLKENRFLTQLMLNRTKIGDDVVQIISGLTRLEELDLSQTAVTDDSLESIARLIKLTTLWLNETKITDQGLEKLRSLKRLEQLDVSGTQVTADGIAKLRASLPRLQEVTGL